MTRETALRRVRLAARDLGAYAEATEHEVLDEVRELAADLRGLRLVQVNSTASGGGVARLLQSLLPLELGLGLDVEWRLLCPDDALFSVTKHLHNASRAVASRWPLTSSRSTRTATPTARRCSAPAGTWP